MGCDAVCDARNFLTFVRSLVFLQVGKSRGVEERSIERQWAPKGWVVALQCKRRGRCALRRKVQSLSLLLEHTKFHNLNVIPAELYLP
jgi:hypothetical protein